MTHLFYMAFIITFVSLAAMAINTQEDAITECKQKHEVTKVELYDLKQQIADGLCLPRLEMR